MSKGVENTHLNKTFKMTLERWNTTIFNWKWFIFSISEVLKTNLFPWDLDRKDSTLNVRSLRDYYFALSFDWPSLFKLMILLIKFFTNKSDFRTDFFIIKCFLLKILFVWICVAHFGNFCLWRKPKLSIMTIGFKHRCCFITSNIFAGWKLLV